MKPLCRKAARLRRFIRQLIAAGAGLLVAAPVFAQGNPPWENAVNDAVNVTTACINAVEHGRYDPSLILAYDIAEALGTNIVEVFPPEYRRPAKESLSQKPWYLRLFSLPGKHQ